MKDSGFDSGLFSLHMPTWVEGVFWTKMTECGLRLEFSAWGLQRHHFFHRSRKSRRFQAYTMGLIKELVKPRSKKVKSKYPAVLDSFVIPKTKVMEQYGSQHIVFKMVMIPTSLARMKLFLCLRAAVCKTSMCLPLCTLQAFCKMKTYKTKLTPNPRNIENAFSKYSSCGNRSLNVHFIPCTHWLSPRNGSAPIVMPMR